MFYRFLNPEIMLDFVKYLYNTFDGLVRLLKIAGKRELLKEKFEIIRVY